MASQLFDFPMNSQHACLVPEKLSQNINGLQTTLARRKFYESVIKTIDNVHRQ